MPRIIFLTTVISSFLLLSCSTNTVQSTPEPVSVFSSYAVLPWLGDVYTCAGSSAVIIRVDDPNSADLALQIGEPEIPAPFAYQVGEEELMIAVHPESSIQTLTQDQAQALFMGLGDPSVQLWVYASGEDIFRVFDQFVMEGRSVASFAKIAATPQRMADVISTDVHAVGILTDHWKTGNVREVYPIATVPVLAITPDEPQGVVQHIIGCLQK